VPASAAGAGGRGREDAPGFLGRLDTVPAIEDLIALGLLLHHLLEGVDDPQIELSIRPGDDRFQRLAERIRGTVRALTSQRIICFADADDPRAERDLVAVDAERIAIAAPILFRLEQLSV